MDMKIEWNIGYDHEFIYFIDRNTVVYISGQYVCFHKEDGSQIYMQLPSYAATKLTVHPSENIFALAETEKQNPKIYFYNYPSLENFGVIKDFPVLDVLKFSFSNCDYLAIVSGIPDFTLSLWNFRIQKKLCEKKLEFQNVTDCSISPVNWKNITIISENQIYFYSIEHCGSLYLMQNKYMKLPSIYTPSGQDCNAVLLDSRVTVAKSASRMISYDFELPPSAKAGVSCKHFKEFLESQDNESRCISASHVWSGTGDLYFGCVDGQLIKLDTDKMHFKMILNPSENKREVLRISSPISKIENMNLKNNIKHMCFAREGIYMAGDDGVVRLAQQFENEISDNVEEIHQTKGRISNLKFNYSYTELAIVSSNGSIEIISANENTERPKSLLNIGHGSFVGIGVLPGNNYIATMRRNGRLQIWDVNNRNEISSIYVNEAAASMDVSPLWNIIGIGLENGNVEIIDAYDPTTLRRIHEIKLHNTPVTKLKFGKRGNIIVTGADDGYVTILSGLVSESFKVLGITSYEGMILDLCVFNNPNADEIVQIAVSAQCINDLTGSTKLVYFEISPTIMNDPSNFYENINGTFDEEAIRKMTLTFDYPTFGCTLGIPPPEEKSPALYAVEIESRCLCKYQIPASPPKKDEDSNKEAMLKILQSSRVTIPGITKTVVDSNSALTPEANMSVESDQDVMSSRMSLNVEESKKDSIRSGGRRQSNPRLSVVDNIDWVAMNKVKAKLNQYDSLPEKLQQQLKVIDKLEELNKAGNKASRLKPTKVFKNVIHEDPQISMLSSMSGRLVATYGSEGVLRVVDIKDERNWAQVPVHQLSYGGVIEAAFSLDSNFIYSCGKDGIFSQHHVGIPNHVKISNEQDYANVISKFDTKILQQNSELKSFLAIEIQGQVESISESTTPITLRESTRFSSRADSKDNKTWSEKRVNDHQEEEDQQYQDTKSSIRRGIKAIRSTSGMKINEIQNENRSMVNAWKTLLTNKIQQMLEENEGLSDLEKIDRQEFELDIDMKKKIHADIETEIKKVIDEIENNNLAKQYILDVIKKECWDQMTVKGRSLCSFTTNMEVTNFPLRDRPQLMLDQIDMVVKRRKIEIEDTKDRKLYGEHLLKSTLTLEDLIRAKFNLQVKKQRETISSINSDEFEEIEDEESKDSSNLTTHDLKDYEKFDKIAPNIKFLYSQMELETRDQKIYQIILLKDIIYQMKVQFNKEFTDVYQKKEQEINRIKEKNSRIVKILNDIEMPHLIQPDPELSSLEKPEKLLVVEDHEIKVERYLTDEQRRKLEEDKLAEEERKRKEKLDNWRERGLEDMMGGVLEVKREDELKKDIPKPAFLIAGKPQEDWTDEEKKIFEEYDKKVKELNDEREKYKKQLEAEYKKLINIIDDAKNAFDEMLLNLFNKQISVQMSIYQEEVKILRIQWSLLVDEELNARRKELLELKTSNSLEIQVLKSIIQNTKAVLDENQEEYDTMVAEEKVMDKQFRREFLDVHGSMFDHITKLYKKRPRNRLLGSQIIPNSQMPNYTKNNPYSGRTSSGKQRQFQRNTLKNAIQDLDKQDAGDTMEPAIYERLCKSRKKRIMKEFEIKQMLLEMGDMQGFYQKRLEEEKNLENNDLQLDSLMETLENYRYQFHVNKEIQLVVKQGQVEVEATSGFIHDFTESVLLHRSIIEDLNKEIKVLGHNKVKHMTKAKDSKKKFIHLEWELRRMLMEYEDLERKKKEIQCFKITKEVQRYLATNDYDGLINAEIQQMEQTINHLKMHHARKLDQKQTRLKYINDSKLIKIKNENNEMGIQMTELNVQVNERKHINAGFPGDNVGQRNVEMRYQKILQRQHLVDLAKSQAREVAVLRSEVERLRMRTFPALIQHKG